jgi:hypothetical protein
MLEQQLKERRGQCQNARTVRDCAIMQSLGRDSGRKAPTWEGHGRWIKHTDETGMISANN